MSPTDAWLVAGFLTQEYDGFADYLGENGIEPTEAEVIIDALKREGCSGETVCVEPFAGLIGE